MILNVKQLHFSYDKEEILKDINFELKKGELLTLIGPNGSGKSTILKCINSYLKAKKGTVELFDKEINSYSREELARIIAYLPQKDSYNFPLNVFETVLMGRKPHSRWKIKEEDKKITAALISELGLEKIAFKNINNLSGGQQQKVFIARMMAQKPEIILLDEPTNNLDLRHQLEIFKLVEEQTEKGISAVITMHDLSLVSRYSDKIIMLREGKVFASGGKDILTEANIREVYGVQVSLRRHNGNMIIIPEDTVCV
ncbi:MAG: ABC transporter ATP-binding protein [Bacillota bacterium]